MVQVCKTCYLIYHAIDGERFQASRSTSKAAARLYNAKIHSTIENSVSEAVSAEETARRPTSPVLKTTTTSRAWEYENKTEGSRRRLGANSSPMTKQPLPRPASASSRLATISIE